MFVALRSGILTGCTIPIGNKQTLQEERELRMKYIPAVLFLLLLPGPAASWGQQAAHRGFRLLQVDASKTIGRIRDFQGVNGQPTPVMAGLPTLVKQYKDLRISLVRTHDMMGPADVDTKFDFNAPLLKWLIPDPAQRSAVVEAGNKSIIFPDPGADPEKPESYNFAPTDRVMAAIQQSGAKVFYRIGRSFGGNTEPPVDPDKYADAVKHIAMHYNQGWAHGFHYGIRYWEFWNEPDGLFWSGTPQQFFQLYEKTARALKSVDPTLKVGSGGLAASAQASPYREGLMDYCARHRVPLDFYSWHLYFGETADPYDAVRLARRFRALLDEHGFPKAENILSEWNLIPDFTAAAAEELRGPHNAAFIGAVLTYLQDSPLDAAIFYRGDAAWMGLFDLRGNYFKTAYTFQAMGRMLDTPERLAVDGADTYGFAALAGKSSNGKAVQILISNYAISPGYKPKRMKIPPDVMEIIDKLPRPAPSPQEPLPRKNIVYRDNAGYNLSIRNLPWGKSPFSLKRYRIGKTQDLELVENTLKRGGTLALSNPLPTDTVELIVLQRR